MVWRQGTEPSSRLALPVVLLTPSRLDKDPGALGSLGTQESPKTLTLLRGFGDGVSSFYKSR